MGTIVKAVMLALTLFGGAQFTSSKIGASATFLTEKVREFFTFFVPATYLGMALYVGVLSICIYFIFSAKRRAKNTILFVLLAMVVSSCIEKGFVANFSVQKKPIETTRHA